jgi:glycosyltransferase involved in cell wall biosynthesis
METDDAAMTVAPARAEPARERWPAAGTPIVIYADEWGGLGGTANYVVMLARGLVARGYRTAVLCHDVPAMEGVMATLADLGAEVLRLRTGPGPIERVRGQVQLVRLLRAYRGGVLAMMMGYHTRGGGVALAARLAGMRTLRADLTPPDRPAGSWEGRALRLKDRVVDAVVVGAEENREAFSHSLGRDVGKVHVVHTGIELERFEPGAGRCEARQKMGLSPEDVLAGTMCRLDDRRKGVHDFIDMAALVKQDLPRARFVVVGDGVLKDELARRADALGLGDSILFPGWASDTHAMYAAMDVFVMASTHEGGPTTVLEAMAMGLPVVATNVGMVPEVMRHGETGLICPVADPAALASAVRTLAASPEHRCAIGRAAREAALANFSVDRMVDSYLDLFGSVRTGRGR